MHGFRFSMPRTMISPAICGGVMRTETKNLRCFASSSRQPRRTSAVVQFDAQLEAFVHAAFADDDNDL